MNALEKAWEVIDHMIKHSYGGNEHALREEIGGDLDDLALPYAEVIERMGLEDEDDMIYLASTLELV